MICYTTEFEIIRKFQTTVTQKQECWADTMVISVEDLLLKDFCLKLVVAEF